jgi:crotonobetainyl-CoA:carnitine CoA-transferase CaiB-like acyl-CoA transferase
MPTAPCSTPGGPAICIPRSSGGHARTVYALVAEAIKERTTDEWLTLFLELQIPAAPLQTLAELFDDPHLNAVGFFETLDTEHGPVRFPGVPTWFSRTAGRVAGPAPKLGADTAQVLEELELTEPACAPSGE